MDDGTRTLEDRQAIVERIYRYCRAVDRLDVPLGYSIFHNDAWADYGVDVYQGAARGVIDLICAQHLLTLHHSHQVTNILIELDRDRAGSEAYCTASLRIEREGRLRQMTIWTDTSTLGSAATAAGASSGATRYATSTRSAT